MKRNTLAILCACGAVITATAVAQWQVNNQIYGNPGPSVRYGWGPGTQRPNSSVPMASEVRYATWSTGTTPSEFRMNRAAMGPITTAGAMSYVSPPGPRYTVGSVGTVGNFVQPQAGAPRSNFMAPASGSVRYAPAPSSISASARVPAPTVSSLNNSAAMFPSLQTSAAHMNSLKVTPSAINASVPTGHPASPSIGSIRFGQ